MDSARRYLVDTNILLRVSQQGDSRYELIGAALKRLGDQQSQLCFTLQNVAEFWNVCTRPVERNGYGLSPAEANLRVEYVERTMTYLPDNERVYSIWRTLVIAHNVHGVQVHDAHLAAVMLAHGIARILTLNPADFVRYSDLRAVHPSQVLE